MKLLVISQNYFPEQFRITDICEELVRRGHAVTVVTGEPNYPMGKIFEGYGHGQRRHEVINGVEVYRTFTIGRRHGVFWRVLNYYSYAMSSTLFVRNLPGDFDVVLVNQLSPVMMAQAGAAYAKKHGKKLVMYTLDLWPESLLAGGIRKGSLPYRYYHGVAKRLYQSADTILVTSKNFIPYFSREFGITQNVSYLPQYAEEMFRPEECARACGESVDIMFAGNVGAAQSVETIIHAAALTRKHAFLRWHIVGDGSELMRCQNLARELGADNVLFHGRKALEDMPRYYAMADAMLVTLCRDEFLSRTLPGKVQTYMAAGKPVLVSADGECADVVEGAMCGLSCPAESAQALAEAALQFCAMPKEERQALGRHAREYYEAHFSRELFFSSLLGNLERNFF